MPTHCGCAVWRWCGPSRRQRRLAHLHYGIGLLEAGRPARAAAPVRRTVAMLPDDPSAWLNFSAALVALGQAPAARAAARRALAKAPRMVEAHYALGLAEQAGRNMAGARTAFLRATGWLIVGGKLRRIHIQFRVHPRRKVAEACRKAIKERKAKMADTI